MPIVTAISQVNFYFFFLSEIILECSQVIVVNVEYVKGLQSFALHGKGCVF